MANVNFKLKLEGADEVDYTKYIIGWPKLSFSLIDPTSRNINYNFMVDIKFLAKYLRDDDILPETLADLSSFLLYIKEIDDRYNQQIWKIVIDSYNYSTQFEFDDIVNMKFVGKNWKVNNDENIIDELNSFKQLYMPVFYYGANALLKPKQRKHSSIVSELIENDIGIEEYMGPLIISATSRENKISYCLWSGADRKLFNAYGGVVYYTISDWVDSGGEFYHSVAPIFEIDDDLGNQGIYLNQDNFMILTVGKNSQDDKSYIVTTPTFENVEWSEYADVSPGRIYPLESKFDLKERIGINAVDESNPYVYPWFMFSPFKLRSKRVYVGYCEKDSDFTTNDNLTTNYGYFKNAQVIGSYIPEFDQNRYRDQISKRYKEGEFTIAKQNRSRFFFSDELSDYIEKATKGGEYYWRFLVPDDLPYGSGAWTDVDNFYHAGGIANQVHIHHRSRVTASYDEITTLPPTPGREIKVSVYKVSMKTAWKEVVNSGQAYDLENSEAGPVNPKEYYYVGDLPLTLEPGYYAFQAEGPEIKFNRKQYPKNVPNDEVGWDTTFSGQLDIEVNKVKPFTITITPESIIPVYQKVVNTGRREYQDEDVATSDGHVLAIYNDIRGINLNSAWRDQPIFNRQILNVQQYNVDSGEQELGYYDMKELFDNDYPGVFESVVRDPHLYYHTDGYIYLAYILIEDPQHRNKNNPYYGNYDCFTWPSGVTEEVHQVIIKRLTWNSTDSKWEWDIKHNRYFVGGNIKPVGSNYGDKQNDGTVAGLIDSRYDYRVTGLCEDEDGNILLGINSSRTTSEELPVHVLATGWYDTDRSEDDGDVSVRQGYVKCLGDVSDFISTGDEVYLYVPWEITSVPVGGKKKWSYPIKHRVYEVDFDEDNNVSYIVIDPPPNCHSRVYDRIVSKENRVQYWDTESQLVADDTTYGEPKLFRVLPKSEPRPELWKIKHSEFRSEDQAWYGKINIDETILNTDNEDFELSSSWDDDKQSYVAEVPTGRIVWEDSPDYSAVDSDGKTIPVVLQQDDDGQWYVETREKLDDFVLTVEVYKEGIIQPVGKMRTQPDYDYFTGVYQNGYFYKLQEQLGNLVFASLYDDHQEKITDARHLITDPVVNDIKTQWKEPLKNFVAQIGDRPRNICRSRLPVIAPDSNFVQTPVSTLFSYFADYGYALDYLDNCVVGKNLLHSQDRTINLTEDQILSIQENRATNTTDDFRLKWGEANYYPVGINVSEKSLETINTDIVNKSDVISRYIYERIVRRNEYPLLKVIVDLTQMDYINHLENRLGGFINIKHSDWSPREGVQENFLFLAFDLNLNNQGQKTATLHLLQLPEEL
jgi:hypothetical protein